LEEYFQRIQKGELTQEDGVKRATSRMRNIRYNKTDYFWVNDLDGSPQVLRNEAKDSGHWLLVKLKGKGGNTDAIGAIVTATAGKLRMMRLVRSGTSYISQDDMRQHFGPAARRRRTRRGVQTARPPPRR
jgi:hypothetical protein